MSTPCSQAGGETDVEKENARLREKTQSLRVELEEGDATRKDLEKSRRMLEEESLSREQERAELQAALNIAEEKLRLYEAFSTTSSDKVVENVKVSADAVRMRSCSLFVCLFHPGFFVVLILILVFV